MNTKEREERVRCRRLAGQPPQRAIFIRQSVNTDRLPHITEPNITLWQQAVSHCHPRTPLPLSLPIFTGSPGIRPVSYIHQTKIPEDLPSDLTGSVRKQLQRMNGGWTEASWGVVSRRKRSRLTQPFHLCFGLKISKQCTTGIWSFQANFCAQPFQNKRKLP